ncbi:cobalamin B12-binding domain-containing protein [Nocardioides houyundeii]|uniref:cobalamin B12-binding domain-containing protein n=1 Tax=Nocardioides houyundeii TaxID=2045452 RepID=UPI00131504E4|nr:cobalamin-dependent protein [Nocardioides houyundeii]
MTAAVAHEEISRYLELARNGEIAGARAVVTRLLGQGVPPESVIVDLLCAAQRELGERWHRNEWSVADEHLVSGQTQRALDAMFAGGPPVPGDRGHVLVVCAEGDWHSLPAQVVAEVLRGRGWDVSCLGASTPAAHVAAYLDRRPATAVAVSCSLPLFFMGVRRIAEVAHERRIPVLAGGRALGTDGRRAAMLGADAWAPDAAAAAKTLEAWTMAPPVEQAVAAPVPPAYSLLQSRAAELARVATESLERSLPEVARYDGEQRARTLEDLEFIVRFVAAAGLVEDDNVLVDLVVWLGELLGHRRVPRAALVAGLEELCAALVPVDANAAELLRHGLAKSSEFA